MKLKSVILLASQFFFLFICGNAAFSQKDNPSELYLEPVFKVDYGDATADKPQSKSWTNNHEQWLIIGDADGPKLLKKDSLGWTSQEDVNREWVALPRRADVWSKGKDVHIVFADSCALTVVEMVYSYQSKTYTHKRKTSLPIPEDCIALETATITQDSKNQFWVCADLNEKIMVWHSYNGNDWSNPFTLADDINKDDISLIVGLKNQVSVIWSNQNTEAVMEKIHLDGDAPSQWSQPIIVQQGDHNADDHLNATVFNNGELAMATKNSVDVMDSPQFVLRIRDNAGKWRNIPYENLTSQRSPSRPIINHVESGKIFEIHAVRNRALNRYFISVNEIIKKKDSWEFNELIQLKTKIRGKNGDVTSSKSSFVADDPKFIFFSDDLGNVYAFDLDTLL